MPPTSGKHSSINHDGGDPLENNAPAYHHHERSNRASFGSGSNGDHHHHHHSKQPPPGGATNILHEDATVPRPVAANGAAGHQPTPLFERLVTEEVQELKAYVRIVENQNRRLAELERVHGDLESRLEVESRARKHLEMTLEAREREWNEKFEHLQSERDHWKRVVEVEQTKNSRLIDQVVRKDQDIHRMLQRKVCLLFVILFFADGNKLTTNAFPLAHQYDHEIGRSVRNIRHGDKSGATNSTTSSRSPELRNEKGGPGNKSAVHKSPHQILAATGSEEKVRVRNAESFLMDFFGM